MNCYPSGPFNIIRKVIPLYNEEVQLDTKTVSFDTFEEAFKAFEDMYRIDKMLFRVAIASKSSRKENSDSSFHHNHYTFTIGDSILSVCLCDVLRVAESVFQLG